MFGWISPGSSCRPRTRRSSEELREFLAGLVTEEVIRRDRETGENFDEAVHLALGAAGYLAADYRSEADGGFSAVRRRIWELEIGRARTPWFHWGTTAMVAKSVQAFGAPELTARILPGVLSGELRLCLGYTEPEGGLGRGDVQDPGRAGCGWLSVDYQWLQDVHLRMPSNAQYVFLITNTDPAAPKHQSLTMFLVPMDSPGVEIQRAIRTVDGDRTNITYYTDVRVDDEYRIGDGQRRMGGAARARSTPSTAPSNATPSGLQKIATMTEHILLTAEAVDGGLHRRTPDYRLAAPWRAWRPPSRSPDMCTAGSRSRRPCATSRPI